MESASRIDVSSWMWNVVVRSKDGDLVVSEVVSADADILRPHPSALWA